jgi:hypothetical protein
MTGSLHASVIAGAADASQRFATAQPFRHVVIDNFLEPALCQALMAEFPSFDPSRARNEHGETGRKAVFHDMASLGAACRGFDNLMRSPAFLDLIGRITGIPKLLYDPEYIGGGTHENLSGQDLDPHVDFNFHPNRRWHRRLNLILFLNSHWDESWGGCLELIRDPWSANGQASRQLVVPIANRAVIFETTERSWHGFERIQLPPDAPVGSRRSIAVYFYTEDRPAEESAAPHGTVYVQRTLAPQIRTGYTLSEQDVEEIRVLIERRDAQIKFLYERELEFSSFIDNLLHSPSFRLGQLLTWPVRAARKLRGSNGGPRH